MLTNLYAFIVSFFTEALIPIQQGVREGASLLFNNTFFTSALALTIVGAGYLLATQKLKSEELAHKIIWTIFVFSFAKAILFDTSTYEWFLSVINILSHSLITITEGLVNEVDEGAKLESVINTLALTVDSITTSLFSQGGWSNIMPYIFGIIAWISGTFLIILILLNAVFSQFLAGIVLSLLPLIIVTLIWTKSEYVFFNFCKLYISLSLYAPFTILFGLVSVHVAKYSMMVSANLNNDVMNNAELIISLVIVQCLIAIGVMKIPNIINQLIGSANEGSSMTSGIGTISAGATAMGAMAKYSGVSFVSKASGRGMKSAYDKYKSNGSMKTGTDKVTI